MSTKPKPVPKRRIFDHELDSAILFAAEVGNWREVKKLLANGADPNAIDKKNDDTPLTATAQFKGYGNVRVARILLSDTDILRNWTNRSDMNALNVAAHAGNTSMAILLKSENLDPHLPDIMGFSAIQNAEICGNSRLAAFLKVPIFSPRIFPLQESTHAAMQKYHTRLYSPLRSSQKGMTILHLMLRGTRQREGARLLAD